MYDIVFVCTIRKCAYTSVRSLELLRTRVVSPTNAELAPARSLETVLKSAFYEKIYNFENFNSLGYNTSV